MVLRLASTAVQHQSPQLQPKQPSLDWCHFVAGLLAIFAGILNLFKAESIAGSSARCTAASWLLCPMEMSASDVWQGVMGGVGESTVLSVPAQAYGACYGKTCFSAVRALLLFQEQRRRAAKTVFVLKYFSGFLSNNFYGNMLLYVVSAFVWDTTGWLGVKIKFTTVPVWLFLYCICLCLSTLLVMGLHDTLGEAESSTIERLARNASWHERWLKVEWKVVLVEDFWERPSGIANFVEAIYR